MSTDTVTLLAKYSSKMLLNWMNIQTKAVTVTQNQMVFLIRPRQERKHGCIEYGYEHKDVREPCGASNEAHKNGIDYVIIAEIAN